MRDNTRHGRLARSFLAIAKHLSEKRPDHLGRRIDRLDSKQFPMAGEDPRIALRREHLGKGQTELSQKRVVDSLKLLLSKLEDFSKPAMKKPSLVSVTTNQGGQPFY